MSFLSKIAGWFQPTYNKIEEWDSPWMREMCSKIWDILPDVTKKLLYNLVEHIRTEYGDELAQKLMASFKKFIDELID